MVERSIRPPGVGMAAAALAAALAACFGDAPGDGPAGRAPAGTAARGSGAPAVVVGAAAYQRTIAFVGGSGSPSMYAAWDFETLTGPDSVQRTVRGWLGREGDWAQFIEERWAAGPSRAPWRIVPRGPVRLVVGEEDVVREVYYEGGGRGVSVRLGGALAEWSGPGASSFQLSRASAALGGRETPGLAIDVSAAAESAEELAGEWGILTGTGGFALVLAGPGRRGRYRSWTFADGADGSWPDTEVEWSETRSFERARRDVPVLWRFRSGDGLAGEFRSASSHVGAVDGEGAVLPVVAVYEVEGVVVAAGDSIPVTGFVRHLQR